MAQLRDIDVVVFDVLGTMVDEPRGIRQAIREASESVGDIDAHVQLWQQHVETAQSAMASGERPYADTDVVDGEAAARVADRMGVSDLAVRERLARAGHRLPPWADAASGLGRLAQFYPVLGLSNASTAALLQLNAHAGLRWHQVLSSDAVKAYKPAAEVYRLAIDVAGVAPERVLMVAAHAWDLRGAQACGMRTAYVERPVGDPPTASDIFDGEFRSLDELISALTESVRRR
ncbi:haloacid dehalogenase type II [Paramicrobacterium agarici]|uniref:2-haloacid dehalogenase n=1 Tax=Paramicrobacterium agarici TaxID=630514 RepID=A0A2A9E173_9MICO|nr:haloacid dehalogenase type II [Microbacterium agarici]PFG31962.1 2-haloacid dehalogenase [Microbacterium agarici]TQO21853.1 2-haloacid dehalogenase [Microbacterium agarici]